MRASALRPADLQRLRWIQRDGARLGAFKGGFEGALIPMVALWTFTLAIDLPQALTDDESTIVTWTPVRRAAFVTAGLVAVLLSGNIGHEAFIYFQF